MQNAKLPIPSPQRRELGNSGEFTQKCRKFFQINEIEGYKDENEARIANFDGRCQESEACNERTEGRSQGSEARNRENEPRIYRT